MIKTMMVYWMDKVEQTNFWGDTFLVDTAMWEEFIEGPTQIRDVLDRCAALRAVGKSHVTSTSDHSNNLSEMGVDGVKDGKLPDGSDYTWKKRR